MAADAPTPVRPPGATWTGWGRIALAAGAAILGIAIVVVVFGNLIDRGAPSASESSGPEESPSPEPTESATAPSSTSPTNAPATGWMPAEIAGVPWVDGIAERDGRLVAVGRTTIDGVSVVMAYSDDGVTWTPVDIAHLGLDDIEPHGPNMIGLMSLAIAAGEPGFVVVGSRLAADFSVEDLYFFSPDGLDWQPADPPEECSAGYGTRAVGSGFIHFGEMCRADGAGPPGPMRVVTSTDGRSWTLRLEAEMFGGPWTTDGDRIVMLGGCCGDPDRPDIAISDDGAGTWRQIPDPFPAGVSVGSLAWGHDRYVAEGTWLSNRPGNPDYAVCASDTGESWTCEALSAVYDPPEGLRAVGAVAPTLTGFTSVLYVLDNELTEPVPLTAVLGTSTDGLDWTFALVPAMKDGQLGGLLGTSHGVFTWGNTYRGEGVPLQPYVLVHLAPLP